MTDKDWVDDAIKFMGWMVPGEIQVYSNDDVDAAKEWASASRSLNRPAVTRSEAKPRPG